MVGGCRFLLLTLKLVLAHLPSLLGSGLPPTYVCSAIWPCSCLFNLSVPLPFWAELALHELQEPPSIMACATNRQKSLASEVQVQVKGTPCIVFLHALALDKAELAALTPLGLRNMAGELELLPSGCSVCCATRLATCWACISVLHGAPIVF